MKYQSFKLVLSFKKLRALTEISKTYFYVLNFRFLIKNLKFQISKINKISL